MYFSPIFKKWAGAWRPQAFLQGRLGCHPVSGLDAKYAGQTGTCMFSADYEGVYDVPFKTDGDTAVDVPIPKQHVAKSMFQSS